MVDDTMTCEIIIVKLSEQEEALSIWVFFGFFICTANVNNCKQVQLPHWKCIKWRK